ncbi:hypothetical protein [Deinococcus xinjiangensis]
MSSLTTVFEWFRTASLGELVGLALAQNSLIVCWWWACCSGGRALSK